MEALEPPLVRRPHGVGARGRLRGPPEVLAPELAAGLRPVPTTVHDEDAICFCDSLLLLNHCTEVLLQADISGISRVTDDTATRPRVFDAIRLTTGRVLHSCPRNSFHVTRASRASDGFGEDINVHYGQEVQLASSAFLCDREHLLHVKEPPQTPGDSTAVLVPRATKRSTWRLWPPSILAQAGREKQPTPSPGCVAASEADLPGRFSPRLWKFRKVRVNEEVVLENVATGRFLASTTETVATDFGTECATSVQECTSSGQNGSALDLRSSANQDAAVNSHMRFVWSFVNDAWSDAVASVETSRLCDRWKDGARDDFSGAVEDHLAAAKRCEAEPAFQVRDEGLRIEQEALVRDLRQTEDVWHTFSRIVAHLRGKGMHGSRQMRRSCEVADVDGSGYVSAASFQGFLAGMGLRVLTKELVPFIQVLADPHTPLLGFSQLQANYRRFLHAMEITSEVRYEAIRSAYQKLYLHGGMQAVTVEHIMELWQPTCYHEVREGVMERREAYEEFLKQWDFVDTHDGYVSPKDFMAYYRDVSACFENTADFVEMMRIAWDL